jgi:hypothetical protein
MAFHKQFKGFAIQVIGIGSEYTVSPDRAQKLIDSGRATQLSFCLIRIVGAKSKVQRKEWVKKRSGPVSVMQLVDTRKVRPRNKPRRLD